MDLLSSIKETHSLWCCNEITWTLNICLIHLVQLEVIASYKGGMDKLQDTSISLMSIRPHMRLDHGIFQLKMQALPKSEEGWRGDKGHKEKTRETICDSQSNESKANIGNLEKLLKFALNEGMGLCCHSQSSHQFLASKMNVRKSEVSLWVSGPHSTQHEILKVGLKWFNCLPLLLPSVSLLWLFWYISLSLQIAKLLLCGKGQITVCTVTAMFCGRAEGERRDW